MILLTALFLAIQPILTSSLEVENKLFFTLRHIHTTHSESGRVRWTDVPEAEASSYSYLDDSFLHTHVIQTRRLKTQRPSSQAVFQAFRADARKQRRGQPVFSLGYEREQSLGWREDELEGPATNKRETLLVLAKMTNNAYFHKNRRGWYYLGHNWTTDHDIGWDPEVDGFRGHVFLSADNTTAVLSIKGTSAGVFGGAKTIKKDKLNDNLLFSCCCARVDWTWSTVCGCYGGGNKCDQHCLEDSLAEESLFYNVGINIYNNLTLMYPNARIWITGHSLGGSLASLIGLTFGAPVVTFEAVPERLAAQRLHLPIPPSTPHITHIYNTADPIAMGICNGVSSLCYLGGYALETRCRLGQSILYDTVNALHWSINIRAHFIPTITEKLLDEDWSEKVRKGKRRWWPFPGFPPDNDSERIEVPEPSKDEDCRDCDPWEFGDYMNKSVRG